MQRIIKFFFIFIIITHSISCLWIFLAVINPGENWMIKKGIQDYSNGEKYLNSLYFHWTSIFTIGYGDILASNIDEKVYKLLMELHNKNIFTVKDLINYFSNLFKQFNINIKFFIFKRIHCIK